MPTALLITPRQDTSSTTFYSSINCSVFTLLQTQYRLTNLFGLYSLVSDLFSTALSHSTITAAQSCKEYLNTPSFRHINTINKMECLEDDWDYEGAKRINSTAISNAKAFVRLLTDQVLNGKLTFFPTELGAVAFRFTSNKGIIRAEIGDDTMSYYIKRSDAPKPEYHSFEQWNTTNIDTLVHSLISIE